MKRILLAQFRVQAESLERERSLFERLLRPLGVTLESICFCEERSRLINPSVFLLRYDAVILGGSADFFLGGECLSEEVCRQQEHMLQRAKPCIEYLISTDFPTLGVCFGHQLLAHFSGARVVHDADQEEKGTFDISLTEDALGDKLFSGVPSVMAVGMVHRNVVSAPPENAILLAHSERCRVASFRLGQNVYGVQFHPELEELEMRERLGTTTESMCTSSIPLSNMRGIALVRSMPYAGDILENFVARVSR